MCPLSAGVCTLDATGRRIGRLGCGPLDPAARGLPVVGLILHQLYNWKHTKACRKQPGASTYVRGRKLTKRGKHTQETGTQCDHSLFECCHHLIRMCRWMGQQDGFQFQCSMLLL